MERIKQKAGVIAIVAALAVFIALYSLWGAHLLRVQQANTRSGGTSVASNI